MISELQAYANIGNDNADVTLTLRRLVYLALRCDMFSMHDLGWCFHFGKGVFRDYEMSV